MSDKKKIDFILGLAKDIRIFLEEKKQKHNLSEDVELEVLIYLLFKILNDRIRAGIIDRDTVEEVLKGSLNQYFLNSNLDLFVKKLDFPSRLNLN